MSVDETMTFAHARVETESDDGVIYTPFIHPDGYVGFVVTDDAGHTEYIYLNPSDHSSNGEPNVFLYHGTTGDPVSDMPYHHYDVLQD